MRQLSGMSLCLAMLSSVLACFVMGCAEPVREDRTIGFSRDGGQVAFQHGQDGVFVADRAGGGVTKIFQPDETVLATSRPLASPTDGRVIFATAEHLTKTEQSQPATASSSPADGQIAWQVPVQVTCWLRDEPKPDQSGAVKKLFTTTCGHVGYVSAGLAVRWHSDGNKILYVAVLEGGSGQHSIFEYELGSGQSRRVFPYAGDAILCDWTPGGSYLVCVVGSVSDPGRPSSEPDANSGIWIGKPGDKDSWWRVPGSEQLSQGELPSLLEMLRASRPAWTRDELQFAFVSRRPNDPTEAKDRHRLHRVELGSRTISTVADADGRLTDLHWSPDGRQLGFVTQTSDVPASITIVEQSGTVSNLPNGQPIRKFAGFDVTGKRLAYVAASPMDPPMESPRWALLLFPDRLARDSVWVTGSDATGPGNEVFSGMRVTFPLWSPTEERLSLWLTFTPRYHSLLSVLRGWGLWPGDPAATLDVRTGAISWLAVTPQEELQIGHYYLLKRDYTEAWRWYVRARQKLPAPRPPQDWQEFTQRIGAPENSQLFEFLCLKRLGQDDEASAKWTEFEQNFFPPVPTERRDGQAQGAADVFLGAFGPQTELLQCLVHDLYVAEVFLSVDAMDDALAHFRVNQPAPASEAAELSRALVMAQLLLIARDHDGYLTHCTDVVAPLTLRMWEVNAAGQPAGNSNFVLQVAGGLCLAPLFRPDFIEGLSASTVRRSVPTWKDYRENLSDGLPAIAVDLVVRAAALKLNDIPAAEAAQERIARNPAGQQLFSNKRIDEVVAGWFDLSQFGVAQP